MFMLYAVLGIRDILVRIRIPGTVPLTNGSGRPKNIRILRIRIPNTGCKVYGFISFFYISCRHGINVHECELFLCTLSQLSII